MKKENRKIQPKKQRRKVPEVLQLSSGICIRAMDVEKYYGNGRQITKAVDRVSFDIKKGEFTAIMGASGSGKTTLLNALATIDRPTAGHIYFQSNNQRTVDITTLSDAELAQFRQDHIGFVFQDYNLLDTLTLEENIILPLAVRKKSKKEIQDVVDHLLKLLEINSVRNQFPHQVSGGQRQRCACARALANQPELIFADEPTGALDSHAAQTLMETFQQMNENPELRATILMVTHDAFSASYCKRILFLRDGRIFHELIRGEENRREFLNRILDVLALTGGAGDVK